MILVEISNVHNAVYAIMGFTDEYRMAADAMLERVTVLTTLLNHPIIHETIDPNEPDLFGIILDNEDIKDLNPNDLSTYIEKALKDETTYRIYTQDWKFGKLITSRHTGNSCSGYFE